MAEFSIFHSTGTSGHGASPYTQAQLLAWLRRTFVGDNAAQGVLKNYTNGLAVSGTATPLTVATGAAVVDGFPYENDAAYSLAVPTPVVGTTGKRVVLRADYTAHTVLIALITSSDGVSAFPALTQSAGVTWEISLATLSVTTGGVITVTDARSFAHYNTMVSESMLDASIAGNGLAGGAGTALSVGVDGSTIEISSDTLRLKDGGITTAKIGDSQVTAVKIANRTRKFLVQPTLGWNVTLATPITGTAGLDFHGWQMNDATSCRLQGFFTCPEDYASGLTVAPVVVVPGTGNLYWNGVIYYGADGETFDTNTTTQASIAEAVTAATTIRKLLTAQSLSAIAAGDIVSIRFQRDGNDALDTIGAAVYGQGWLVSYTADS